MAVAFEESDLLPDISQEELSGIAATLVASGDPQPIASYIAASREKVDLYTNRYVLDDNHEKALIRALCLFELYSRLGSIPEKRKLKYDEAMRELREIRDGKFQDLPQKDPLPDSVQPYEGRWGSKTKLNTR